jgi:hypothetical protein
MNLKAWIVKNTTLSYLSGYTISWSGASRDETDGISPTCTRLVVRIKK